MKKGTKTRHTFKLEVGKSNSQSWPWFVRLAKKVKGYKIEFDGDLETHIVKTQNLDTIVALYQIARTWKQIAFYIDGQIIGAQKVGRLMWEIEWRPEHTRRMLNDIIEKKQKDFADRRDRMGLGDEPPPED